jgi:hypothetical protein
VVEKPFEPCCPILAYYLRRECAVHDDPWECPDRLFYRATDGEIGIMLHDGGVSFVTMLFCPFCGQALPTESDPADVLGEGTLAHRGDPLRRIDLGALGDD